MRIAVPILFFLSSLTACQTEPQKPFIAVNLAGYPVDSSKEAFLINAGADSFSVLDVQNEEVVYKAAIEETYSPDEFSGDEVAVIDFSNVTTSGNYIIETTGSESVRSDPIALSTNPYKELTLAAVQSYYYNRCGMDIDNGNPWTYPACHLDDAPFYDNPDSSRDVTGGWHDAGDYNKFSVNTALSIGLLLNLYEMRPELFIDSQLNITEAGNNVPDLLDEVRWALKWLLKMQNSEGAVYHKASQKRWIGEFLPQEDPAQRYIFGTGTNATATFGAVTALAAQLYESFDREFSDRLLESSKLAWTYLENHPTIQPEGGFQNPDDVQGGEYGDEIDLDARMWAAIELYKATDDEKYLSYFADHYAELGLDFFPPLSWRDFSTLALSTFIRADLPEKYEEDRHIILQALEQHAEELIIKQKQSNYKTLLDAGEYYWGSNSVALGYAYPLIVLHQQTEKEVYREVALDQLHYSLGRNPFHKVFLTGLTVNSVQNPYHQLSMELEHEKPVPGMAVGGPNNRVLLNDEELSPYPAKSYEDSEKNYYVNEVAINWTAIFAFTAGYFSTAEEI